MKRFLKVIPVSILFFILGFFLFFFYLLRNSLPEIEGKFSLQGLTAEVEVIRDQWGVPHIFAQNENDLFFVCGYIHAQDRMWQMELTRRTGFGKLSEIFGDRTLKRDKVMKTLSLEEASQRDYEKLSPRMKSLLKSYSDGINAWINSRKFNWPPEFLLLRFRPRPWRIRDSLIIKEIMALLLSGDFQSEALRAKLVRKVGVEKALQILEEGIEFPSTEGEKGALPDWMVAPDSRGSNSWVLAGPWTESGKPLLANDPHLRISLPSIWHEVHLHCPTLDVVGVTFPGIPGVIIGHNESIAWGITNSGADVQDLYVEKINVSRDMYLDEDGWKPLKKKEKKIWVKGKNQPEKLTLLITEKGPVISPEVIESRSPLSLKWTIYEGGKTFEAIYLLNKARAWQEFLKALALFDVPPQNFIYADREGNIGYHLSGRIPLRPKKTALFPFPGWIKEGSWQGFIKEEEKPTLYNPQEGFIVTANNNILPEGYPYYVTLDWLAPFRAQRIRELILQYKKHNRKTQKKIQNDLYSKKAEFYLSLVQDRSQLEGDAGNASEILKKWDLEMTSGKEPVLFMAFMDVLHEEVFKDELGREFEKLNPLFGSKQSGLLRIIADPLSRWFDKKETDGIETRDEIIEISLKRAYKELKEEYGSEEKWDWKKMNSFSFQHALGEGPFLKFFNRGPYQMDGDASTIRAFSLSKGKVWGTSYRQIIDLSNFRNSISIISSGQSGHFLSRFYDDQIPYWLEGKYHPMLFYRDEIEEKAAGVLKLFPRKD